MTSSTTLPTMSLGLLRLQPQLDTRLGHTPLSRTKLLLLTPQLRPTQLVLQTRQLPLETRPRLLQLKLSTRQSHTSFHSQVTHTKTRTHGPMRWSLTCTKKITRLRPKTELAIKLDLEQLNTQLRLLHGSSLTFRDITHGTMSSTMLLTTSPGSMRLLLHLDTRLDHTLSSRTRLFQPMTTQLLMPTQLLTPTPQLTPPLTLR
jgi:hypothetical protein